MAHDLLFGRTQRNFSRDVSSRRLVGAALPLPTPDLSTKAMLEQKIKSKAPELPPELPPDKQLLERLREAAPETMKTYDKYRPTYKDHKVVVRMKTDLLGTV